MGGFAVTFVGGPGRTTEMCGPGSVVIDAQGLRFVGPRRRLDAAFYGACGAALVATIGAIWIVTTLARQHLVSVMGARPLLLGAGLCVFGLLCITHTVLIRVLPLATEDRHVDFASGVRIAERGDALEIQSAQRGFEGATRFEMRGGPAERARFLEELEVARAGGPGSYRTATPTSSTAPSTSRPSVPAARGVTAPL